MNRKTQLTRLIHSINRCARSVVLLIVVLFITSSGSVAQAQIPEPPLPIDPRPIGQLLSESEKSALAEAQAHGSKKTVEIYLKFSDSHLQAAFDAIRLNNHDAAERELDIYNKAMAEAGKQTFALKDGKRSLSKRIEQTLYRQIKTLESIDRLFPNEREAFAEAALKHAKQLRVQALNEAFAAGGVLKDTEDKPNEEPPLKESGPKPPRSSRQVSPSVDLGSSGFRTIRYYLGDSRTPVREPRYLQIPGDYLTEEEDDHVREAQAADARVKVFMKIADRRISGITGQPAPPDKKDQKKAEAEEREWGAVPKLTRAELLRHYTKAIAECLDKLEDAYERNPKSSSLPKALALLKEATDRHLQSLRTLQAETKDVKEAAALRDAIEQAEIANKGARDGLKKTPLPGNPKALSISLG